MTSAGDAPRVGLYITVGPAQDALYVRVIRRMGSVRRPSDQHLVTLRVDDLHGVSLDDPGPLLLALSDALAHCADNYAPQGRARHQHINLA